MNSIVMASFTSYIIACVIAGSSLFSGVRDFIIRRTPFLSIKGHKHFIECRLCLSFWTSLMSIFAFSVDFKMLFAVYGISYFLATQER